MANLPLPLGVPCPLNVLVVDGGSAFAHSVIRCLGAVRGVRIHVLARQNRVSLRASNGVASLRLWKGIADPNAPEQLLAHARELGIDVCLAVDTAAIEVISGSGILESLRFCSVPTLESLHIANDKWRFAELMMARGTPHPRTVLCVAGAEGEAALRALAYPVLIKPTVGGFGGGIERFENADALLRHFASRPHLWATTLAQEVVPGEDIDCSVLCANGQILAHTIQRGFTASVGYRPPGGIEFTSNPRVLEIVSTVMRDLCWSGVAHVDLRIHAATQAVSVLEINPRYWGSLLGSLHAGVNFPLLACMNALGLPFPYPEYRHCRYVAGAEAMHFWRKGQFGRRVAGFALADTVFRYMLLDPISSILEQVLK